MCSVLQTSTIGNFKRKADGQYQTRKMPKSSFFWSMAASLGDVVVVVARRTRPRAMPLATMTMKTQTHGFRNFYLRTVVMGLRSAALRAAGELRYNGFTLPSLPESGKEEINFLCTLPFSNHCRKMSDY